MRNLVENNKMVFFFGLTIIIGWSPWFVGKGYIIFAAPTISTIIIAGVTEGKTGLKAIWRRLANWRVSPRSYLAALLIPAFTSLMALGLHLVIGGTLPGFPLFSNPVMLIMTFLMFMLPWQSSAFMEEVGFRGYALEELQKRWGIEGDADSWVLFRSLVAA